jgi:hypothetical protein
MKELIMSLYKMNDVGALAVGMTYAEAKELILADGYMFEYLPEVHKTPELRMLASQWWEDRFLRFYDYYRCHPQETAEIIAQASVASKSIQVAEHMRFEVELSEI